MSDIELIESALQRTARRRRWLLIWKGFGRGAFVGALIWFLTFGLYKVFPLPVEAVLWTGIAALVLPFLAALSALFQKVSLLETARWVDDQRRLKERLSTALEFSRESDHDHWKRLVVSDAAQHVREVQPRQLLPFRFPLLTRWALVVLALGVGLGFVPEYRSEAFLKRNAEIKHVREVGKSLADMTRQSLETRPPITETARETIEDVAKLGDFLSKAKLTRAEAMDKLSSRAESLRQEMASLGDKPLVRPLERNRDGSATSASRNDMQEQMDALQKAMGNTSADPQKLDQLNQKLRQLQKQAASMPDKNSDGGQQAREQLAQALAALSQEAKNLGTDLPSLDEAIEALRNNQTDHLLQNLDAAMHDMEKLQSMAKAMQQLKEQMTQMGKDLAEQLEKGQVEAAQDTLEKMMKSLQNPALSQEQMQKMMQEIADAIDPAGEYGKAAEFLKEAGEQLQQGQNPGAAQSLADAAKELEKMRQQMQDAKDLMEAMAALERAQNAVASGKSWEECQGKGFCQHCGGAGCGMCRSEIGRSWGQGGGIGAGVGTWADEGLNYRPTSQQRVDNSGVVRPDMDSRGLSDRPDDLNPSLNPTKVRGKMSPGRSMPSITLKGVHIKGESSVEFEEAAATAQTDAENALNQDRVPRPYLNTVRDYFDDLKE